MANRLVSEMMNDTNAFDVCVCSHALCYSSGNRDNRFIGWTDTPLTEDGVLEARVAGE